MIFLQTSSLLRTSEPSLGPPDTLLRGTIKFRGKMQRCAALRLQGQIGFLKILAQLSEFVKKIHQILKKKNITNSAGGMKQGIPIPQVSKIPRWKTKNSKQKVQKKTYQLDGF